MPPNDRLLTIKKTSKPISAIVDTLSLNFGILQDNIYNMDETGFRIECLGEHIVITHATTKVVYLADTEVRD